MNIAFPAFTILPLLLPELCLGSPTDGGSSIEAPTTLGSVRDEIGPGIVLALFIHRAALVIL